MLRFCVFWVLRFADIRKGANSTRTYHKIDRYPRAIKKEAEEVAESEEEEEEEAEEEGEAEGQEGQEEGEGEGEGEGRI